MFRSRYLTIDNCRKDPSLADFLTARPSGLTEPESWAVLCQAIQALQDLFLSGKLIKSSIKEVSFSLRANRDPLDIWAFDFFGSSAFSICAVMNFLDIMYQPDSLNGTKDIGVVGIICACGVYIPRVATKGIFLILTAAFCAGSCNIKYFCLYCYKICYMVPKNKLLKATA